MYFVNKIPFFSVILFLMSACSGDPSMQEEDDVGTVQQSYTAAQWKALSQTSRNQLILDRTAKDIGKVVGIQCKPWVSKVVLEASTNVASVTQTVTSPTDMTTNAEGWALYQPHAYAIGMSSNIRDVQPGWIVQMRLHNSTSHAFTNPHTAIVVGKTSTGVNFVDSNFVNHKTAPNTVGTHFMSFTDFEAQTLENGVYQYSVYYISGG
jgi:hypothetical protein